AGRSRFAVRWPFAGPWPFAGRDRWPCRWRRHHVARRQVDDPRVFPAAVARFVAQPAVQGIERRPEQCGDKRRISVIVRGRVAAVDLVLALERPGLLETDAAPAGAENGRQRVRLAIDAD